MFVFPTGTCIICDYIRYIKTVLRRSIYTLIAVAVVNLAGCAVYPAGQPVAYGPVYPQVNYGGGVPGNYYPAPYPVQPQYVEPYYAPIFPFYGFFGYHHGDGRHYREGHR